MTPTTTSSSPPPLRVCGHIGFTDRLFCDSSFLLRRLKCAASVLSLRIEVGRSSSRCCPVVSGIEAGQQGTIDCFLKRYCGRCALAAHGEISHQDLANGTACFGGSADGPNVVCFSGFSRLYRVIRTLNMFLSMARSSASTRKRVAQKGDSQSGHRAFERRIDHQGSGTHRCVR